MKNTKYKSYKDHRLALGTPGFSATALAAFGRPKLSQDSSCFESLSNLEITIKTYS
jgi:hypothetical protein